MKTLDERFWEKVEIAHSGCWLWRAGKNQDGYGTFKVDGVSLLAHQFAWQFLGNTIPAQGWWSAKKNPNGWQLDHDGPNGCCNKDCVNPSHLVAVPAQVNRRRMKKTNTSGFTGVRRLPSGRWRAEAKVGYKTIQLGIFDTPELASVARESFIQRERSNG